MPKKIDKDYPYGEVLSKCDTAAFITAIALVVQSKQDKHGQDNKHKHPKS